MCFYEFTVSDHLILRMAVASPRHYEQSAQQLLDNTEFIAALYLASPVFWEALQKKGYNAAVLSPKEANTLRKYINRYCFRPTPFGLFSSVSLIRWGEQTEISGDHAYFPVIRADQTFQQRLLQNCSALYYEVNPAAYRALKEFRFIRTGLDEMFKRREYQLQSVAYSKLLKDLAAFCGTARLRSEIGGFIARHAACLAAEAADYTEFLIAAQLLVPASGRTITEDDGHAGLEGIPTVSTLRKMETELSVTLHRKVTGETLEKGHQQQLKDGLFALVALGRREALPALAQFTRSFQEHFEGRLMPLLTLLDPEVGIGYQEAVKETANPLLETVQVVFPAEPNDTIHWTAAHRYLFEAWQRASAGPDPVIRLQKEDLEKIRPGDQPLKTLGMSMLFRVIGKELLIESAGGCNPAALAGRFTVGNPSITHAVRDLTRAQEAANPELLFAEILHLSDPHVDNINCREIVRTYELPLTANSTLPKERQIALSDLYVYVAQNKVMLYSRKHNKVVIPTLTSAYNHSLNRLPLFRFLCDLAYQYVDFNLGLDLRQYFPKLNYYPRVTYGPVILALATWILNETQLRTLQDENFELLAEKIGLPQWFSLNEADQQIVFNRAAPGDVLFFFACVAQKKMVILREHLPQHDIKQYNAFLLPAEPLSLPPPAKTEAKPKAKRKYIAGSEWLYLKIYTPRIGASRLLLQIKPVLRNVQIRQWFFIRYEDRAPHIRLRIQAPPAAIGEILLALKDKLEDRVQHQVIREYQVDTYSREIERYAAAGMEKTEAFFWASSELVLACIARKIPAHHVALYSTLTMIQAFFPAIDLQITYCLNSYTQFLREFSGDQVRMQLDKKFRELAPEINTVLASAHTGLGRFKKAVETLAGSTDLSYIQSMIHMHLNRVFTDDARQQEMITYYLLYKYLNSKKARLSQDARLVLTK
jgi:thiopeptide-type bacteriocin biosynthesis protein